MISSNYKINKAKSPLLTPIVTRGGIFAGLSFKTTKESDITKTNYLSSVPTITFSFDYERVIFDYGSSENENDKELIQALFKNFTPGLSFTVSQASFKIEDNQSMADLSGTYSFVRLIGNSIVARPGGLANINNRLTVYQNKHFLSIPQIGTNLTPVDNIVTYTITNSMVSDKKNSFINLGIYPNDIIKISGSLYNDKSFKVLSVTKNSDGTETIITNTEVIDEVAFGNSLVLQVVQNGAYELNKKEFITDENIGSCLLSINNERLCFSNQTENQCAVRASEKYATERLWTLNGICTGTTTASTTSSLASSPRRRIQISRIVSGTTRSLSTGTNQTTTQAI